MRYTAIATVLIFSFIAMAAFAFSGEKKKTDADFLPSTLLIDGVNLAKKKKFDKASEKFNSALEYWQVSAGARLYLRILKDFEDKQFDKKTAQRIFKAISEDFHAKHQKAIKAYDKLLKKNEDYAPLYALKAEALLNAEQSEEAESAFEQAVKIAPDDAIIFLMHGKFYSKMDAGEKAISAFTKAIRLEGSGGSPISRFERGFAYCLDRQYDSAIADFMAVKKRKPGWYRTSVVLEAFHNRGAELLAKKSYRKALKDFDTAIAIDPDNVTAYLNRGLAYRGIKKYSQAIAEFTICIERKTDFVDAYEQRALTHFKRKHYKKAIADLEKALKLRPGDKQFQYKLAECYYKQGQYKSAIANFNKVIEQDQNFFWAHYWKAYSHTYLGQSQAAIAAFNKFLSIVPAQYQSQRAYAEAEIRKLKGGG